MSIHAIQKTNDPRVADLLQAGKVRVGLFPPQYVKDPVTGELGGSPFIEIGGALAAHLGLDAELIGYPNPRKFLESLNAGACDVGFAGTERAAEVSCSPPFMEVDYTFLVPPGSSIGGVADTDRPGVRIVAVSDHLSTLALRKMLQRAELREIDTPDGAFENLRAGNADVLASIRPVLLGYSSQLPGSRVLADRYGANLMTIVMAKG